MDERADLHIHTTASDGALSPARVVETAAALGLSAISLTDHDTVVGLDEAIEASQRFGIEVVPGIEFTTRHERLEVHVLGYFIDHRSPQLLDFLRVLTEKRFERGMKMVERLNEAGVSVSFERVMEIAGGGTVGRPHVARAIYEAGAVGSMDAAFGRFLQEGGPAYVESYRVSPSEVMRLIHETGGVASVAHVAKLKRDEIVIGLIDEGLKAIEVFHPDHSSAASRFYMKFAAKRGLIATGGSDAHCYPDGRHPGIGSVTVDCGVVRQLRSLSRL